MAARKPKGTVYLFHFHQPIGSERHQATHYVGWAENLERRIAEHFSGQGARIMAYVSGWRKRDADPESLFPDYRESYRVQELAITWDVVVLAEGVTRDYERAIKRHRNHKHYCPVCVDRPRRPRKGIK